MAKAKASGARSWRPPERANQVEGERRSQHKARAQVHPREESPEKGG
jgi:hypothetical protein